MIIVIAMGCQRTRACEHLRRRDPPSGIPRPIRLGGHTERRRERRLRLAQRDSGTHAACRAPRRHTMPSAQAVGKRAGGARRTSVSQSSSLTGHFCSPGPSPLVPRQWAQSANSLGKWHARQDSEPATLGLSHNGTTGSNSQRVGYVASWSTAQRRATMRKEPVMRKVQFCRSRCARGHDRGRRGGAGRDGAVGGGAGEARSDQPGIGTERAPLPRSLTSETTPYFNDIGRMWKWQ